jgi:hypothetical protein
MADKTLQIRLSEEQYDNLQEEADREDRTISWVARNRMFNSDGRPRIAGPKVGQVIVDEAADYPTEVTVEDEPFGSGDRQEESAIASDEATAVITRRVTSTKPKADDFEKTRRPGEYTASEMADIDAERLARMKTGKRK